ncbi:uracil-DNA glycosylase family protein [Fusobacterium animalis]|uniref:uracil-DNA glycosylase family protein n=1 Tax=Fusobacterium animalis TaxID=76859 RepID=UPI0034DF87D4
MKKKIRYPKEKEINYCFEHLVSEISVISPKIVFLLGEIVCKAVAKRMKIDLKKWDDFKYYYKNVEGIYYIPIHHPSYIHRTKKKNMKKYF